MIDYSNHVALPPPPEMGGFTATLDKHQLSAIRFGAFFIIVALTLKYDLNVGSSVNLAKSVTVEYIKRVSTV